MDRARETQNSIKTTHKRKPNCYTQLSPTDTLQLGGTHVINNHMQQFPGQKLAEHAVKPVKLHIHWNKLHFNNEQQSNAEFLMLYNCN